MAAHYKFSSLLKMVLKIFTVFAISMCLSANGAFPDDIKPCKYGDLECIKTTINSIFKDHSQGDESMNLPQLNPLKFDSIRMHQGEESAVSLDLELKDSNIYGFDTAKVLKVKGFGKDLTKKHSLHIHADYLSTVGGYDVNGKILILPIKGSGKSNITMVDVDLLLNFIGVPLVKDGATYMHIEQINLNAEPKNITYKVENLFNGDKVLGDNMNLFLNENWREIYAEVRDNLTKAYGELFKDVINSVFEKIPYDKYFTE